jgi:hypothetical protein
MGWLDANEVYMMEAVARDRVEELQCTAHLARASTDRRGDAPGNGPESENVRPPDDSVEICRGPRRPRQLGAPRLAC